MVDSLNARNILSSNFIFVQKFVNLELSIYDFFQKHSLQKQIDGTLLRAVYTVRELDRQEANQGKGTVRTSFSPDGKLLASAGEDCKEPIRVSDLQGQTLSKSNQIKFKDKSDKSDNFNNSEKCEPVKITRFSPNSQQLAAAGANGTVGIWDLRREDKELTLTNLKKLHTNQGEVKSISFSPNGKLLATTGANGTVLVWNLDNLSKKPEILRVFNFGKQDEQKEHNVWSVAFSPDGKRLAITGTRDTIRLWEREGNKWKENEKIKLFINIKDERHKNKNDDVDVDVTIVSFSLDGQKLVTAGTDDFIRVWDLTDQKLVKEAKEIRANQNKIWEISFTSDGQKLASAGEDGTARLWDFNKLKNGQPLELEKFEGHHGPVRSVSFSRDHQQLASAGDDSSVRLWNLQGNESEKPVPMKEASTNNQEVMIQKGDQRAFGEKMVMKIKSSHVGKVKSWAFSPDDSQLASGGEDRTIRLWNEEGEQEHLLPTYAEVNSMAYSPDQQLLASAGEDGTVQLWNLQDLQEGKPLAAQKAYPSPVKKVSFSRDGKVLITVGEDRAAKLQQIEWRIESSYVMQQACDHVRDYLQNNPNLSESDRQLCNGISEPEKHGKMSMGDKILVPTLTNPNKLAGVEAIRNGDFTTAINPLKAYLKNKPNDPEALIYLNNARIGTQKSYTIAISAPISSDVNGALEMLRGVAQAQNEINQAGGINKVPLRIIADDKNEPDTTNKIAE
jgi:WD40 repeat protein